MHLDDDTVLRMVRGELAPAALAGADAHLDACGDCRALIAALARGSGGAAPAPALARGAVIGRYVVGDELGGGAMGVVYAAWDPELDRRVALKVLRDGGDPARARREAQAMARLAHPNVVTVHEVGVVDERVFVAMELVDGDTLGRWARGRRWSEVCDALVQVGRGLAAAHAAGVVHRDVKPDNVIVGGDGRVRIGDFGLAGAGDEPGLAGTPAYMAPECLRGGAADPRSDQFSYCVTFFEALHGTRPFAGASVAALRQAIEARRIVATRDRVPGWLDAMLARGLSAAPDARWPSVAALVDAIAARRQRRTRRWVGAIAAAAVASAVTAAIVSARAPAPRACDAGDAQIAEVWDHAARARVRAGAGERAVAAIDRWAATWADTLDAVCRAPSEHGVRGDCLARRRAELAALVERLAVGDVALAALDAIAALPAPADCAGLAAGAADPVPPSRRAAIDDVRGGLADAGAALAVGDVDAAIAVTAPLVDAAAATTHAPTLGEAWRARAGALRAAGRLGEADDAAHAALFAAQRGRDELGAARAWLDLATLAGERRDLDLADERARHAEAAIARAGEPPPLVRALTALRGLVAYNRGDLDAAEALLARALALAGDDDVEVARLRSSLGHVARGRGDLDAARGHHEAALATDRRRLGPRHPAVARDLHNLAGVRRLAGDLAGARATYEEALAIERAALGDAHPATGLTRNSLGLVALAEGRLDDAAREFEAARAILDGAGHGERAITLHNLGLVAQRRGDHRAALGRFDEALAVYRATVGDGADGAVRLRADRAISERALAGASPRRRVAAAAPPADPPSLVPAPEPGAAPPPPPAPARDRDVGVYGSGQAW